MFWEIMPIFSIDVFIDEVKTIDLSNKPNDWFIKLFLILDKHLINIEKEKQKEKVDSERLELDEQYNNNIQKIQNLKILGMKIVTLDI